MVMTRNIGPFNYLGTRDIGPWILIIEAPPPTGVLWASFSWFQH